MTYCNVLEAAGTRVSMIILQQGTQVFITSGDIAPGAYSYFACRLLCFPRGITAVASSNPLGGSPAGDRQTVTLCERFL